MRSSLVSVGVPLSQSAAARSAAVHGDPAMAATAAFLGLLAAWAWYCLVEGHDRELRRVDRIVSMSRRRYAGRRFAWLRSEAHISHVSLCDVARRCPPMKWVFVVLVASMLAPITAAVGGFLPWATVRGRRALAETLDAVDAAEIIAKIEDERYMGRHGYPPLGMWRAYLASFVLGLPSTNALIRQLQDDPELRLACGLGDNVPHRTTFNRFIRRLSRHRDLVDRCMAGLTDHLADLLPGLGEKVAVDSTVVRSHSNPNRKSKVTGQVSDPDASWTAKNSARGKGQKEWSWGFKYHAVVDATYGVPLGGYTTTASRNDSPELPGLLDRVRADHPWGTPTYVMADKGYDARSNHEAVAKRGGVLICPARRPPNADLYEGVYTPQGVPTCLGMMEMEYVRSDPDRGHLYRCPRGGCHLRGRKGIKYCSDEFWENRSDNPRLFGPLRQQSQAWKDLYRKRQTVERVFKSMKESRRLERHFVRGLANVALHAAMSVLAYSATVLAQIRAGSERPRWMVRKVA